MPPLLKVRDLRYHYPPLHPGVAGLHLWGAGLSFDLDAGRCLAVTGPGGHGKSTLLLAVAGLAPRLSEGRLEGRILLEGQDVQALPLGSLAGRIGLMMQDPTGQLFNETIEGEIAWGLENLGLPPEEMRRRIRESLVKVGLAGLAPERHPLTLSGGQGRRVALAAALALQPRLLVLDEPAGGLNPGARAKMIEVLLHLKAQGLAILISENDPEVIEALADDLLILSRERIEQQGPPAELYALLSRRPFPWVAVPPSSRLLAALGQEARPGTVEQVAARIGPLRIPASQAASPPRGEVAVQVEGLVYRYGEDPPAIDGLDLCLHRGEILALMGDNGAGKSTLARLLIGLLRPLAGHVIVEGQPISGRPTHEIARQVSLAFQNPELQIFNATVSEEVAAGPKARGLSAKEVQTVVARILGEFELEAVQDVPPAVLSFGERRIVSLASIAAMDSPVLVLDEPTVGLDATRRDFVVDWLRARRDSGRAILLITHDAELAAACVDRVALIHAGRPLKAGPVQEVFMEKEALQQAGLVAPFTARLATALGIGLTRAALTPEGFAAALQEPQP